ncbi:MAG TPA: M23 family metallopeptidase, partial [Stenomitos sp.]
MRGFALALLGALLLTACADNPTATVPQVNPLPGAKLTSAFGPRTTDPVTGKALVDGHHDGYDLAAAMGTPIRAAKTGTVTFAGNRGGYGNAIILTHAGGWSTLYGHASRLAVKEGQTVQAGQVIAYVGSTGHSTGPHLHYELRRNGVAVDPALALAAGRPLAPSAKVAKSAGATRKVAKRPAPSKKA